MQALLRGALATGTVFVGGKSLAGVQQPWVGGPPAQTLRASWLQQATLLPLLNSP